MCLARFRFPAPKFPVFCGGRCYNIQAISPNLREGLFSMSQKKAVSGNPVATAEGHGDAALLRRVAELEAELERLRRAQGVPVDSPLPAREALLHTAERVAHM